MKILNKVALLFVLATQTIYAQTNQETNPWKSGRPDGHAPISVMGDHYHNKGDIMFSYRYMYMNMSDLLQRTSAVNNSYAHDAGYMVTPLKMPMQMHMLGVMYAVSNKVTLSAMMNYITNNMDLQMRMPSGMTSKFSTKSNGLGDLKLGLLYKFINKNKNSLHGIVGLSIPTGTIEAEDETPMSSPSKVQLPYPMQIGSGTYDLDLGFTYLGQTTDFSWGSQLKATYRFGKNEYEYSLGNKYSFNNWFAYKTNNWLSFSGRLEGLVVESINGANPNLMPMMVTTADTSNSGGTFINAGVGFNLYAFKGSLKNVRFGFEYALPIYQEVIGIQLAQQQTITAGIQYSL